MLTAKVMIEVISLVCPYCDEVVANSRNWALHFTGEDRDELVQSSYKMCEHCLQNFKLPKFVQKLGVPA
jgi:hypothetical protein